MQIRGFRDMLDAGSLWGVVWGALLVALLAGIPPGPARAAPLEYTAVLTLDLGPTAAPLGNPPAMELGIAGTGVADVTGSGPASFSLASGALSGTTAETGITAGAGSPLRTLSLGFPLRNAAGVFTASGGAPGVFGGAMPNLGTARMVIFPFPALTLNGVFSFPVGATGTSTTLVSSTTLDVGFQVPVVVSMEGGRWRTGPITVNATHLGTNTVTVNGTGFDARTPSGLGLLQLVSPLRITTTVGAGVSPQPGIAVLQLHFLPEPAALLGLGSGAALLAVLGWRRRRG